MMKDLPVNKFVKGEEREVRPGFARNFLIPQKIAVYFSRENREAIPPPSTEILAELARKRSLKLAAKRLASVTVLVKRKMMSDGSPIAPVSALQVAQKMMKQYKIRLSPDQIKLPNIEQLTTFGNHQLKVTIEGDELPLNVLVKQL